MSLKDGYGNLAMSGFIYLWNIHEDVFMANTDKHITGYAEV